MSDTSSQRVPTSPTSAKDTTASSPRSFQGAPKSPPEQQQQQQQPQSQQQPQQLQPVALVIPGSSPSITTITTTGPDDDPTNTILRPRPPPTGTPQSSVSSERRSSGVASSSTQSCSLHHIVPPAQEEEEQQPTSRCVFSPEGDEQLPPAVVTAMPALEGSSSASCQDFDSPRESSVVGGVILSPANLTSTAAPSVCDENTPERSIAEGDDRRSRNTMSNTMATGASGNQSPLAAGHYQFTRDNLLSALTSTMGQYQPSGPTTTSSANWPYLDDMSETAVRAMAKDLCRMVRTFALDTTTAPSSGPGTSNVPTRRESETHSIGGASASSVLHAGKANFQEEEDGGYESINDFKLLTTIARTEGSTIKLGIYDPPPPPPQASLQPNRSNNQHGSRRTASVSAEQHQNQPEQPEPQPLRAIKIMKRRRGIISGHNDRDIAIRREVAIMKSLKHPHVVRLREVIDDPNHEKVYLIMDYVCGGFIVQLQSEHVPLLDPAAPTAQVSTTERSEELEVQSSCASVGGRSMDFAEVLGVPSTMGASSTVPTTVVRSCCQPISVSKIRKYLKQLADAIAYCHKRGVIHRDIKPDNVLLDAHDNVQLTDFGVSVMTNSADRGGTPHFTAPELLLGASGSELGSAAAAASTVVKESSDCWSLGVMLYCMMYGRLPFQEDTLILTVQAIASEQAVACKPFAASQRLHEMVMGLLQKDVSKRWTMDMVRNDLFFGAPPATGLSVLRPSTDLGTSGSPTTKLDSDSSGSKVPGGSHLGNDGDSEGEEDERITSKDLETAIATPKLSFRAMSRAASPHSFWGSRRGSTATGILNSNYNSNYNSKYNTPNAGGYLGAPSRNNAVFSPPTSAHASPTPGDALSPGVLGTAVSSNSPLGTRNTSRNTAGNSTGSSAPIGLPPHGAMAAQTSQPVPSNPFSVPGQAGAETVTEGADDLADDLPVVDGSPMVIPNLQHMDRELSSGSPGSSMMDVSSCGAHESPELSPPTVPVSREASADRFSLVGGMQQSSSIRNSPPAGGIQSPLSPLSDSSGRGGASPHNRSTHSNNSGKTFPLPMMSNEGEDADVPYEEQQSV